MYQRFAAPSTSAFPAVPLDYSLVRLDGATFSPMGGSLESRDLGLGRASAGQMGARHVRATKAGRLDGWPADHAAPLRFLYVLAGSLTVAGLDEAPLTTGDALSRAALGAGIGLEVSGDFQAVEIVAPDFGGARGAPAELLAGLVAGQVAAEGTPMVVRGSQPFQGGGLRPFMTYLDLGLTEATERRMHIQAIRCTATPPGGTGWHVHSMSQLFYVTDGWVDIAVDGAGVQHMVAGDAMCIGNGLRHNVFQFSPDYELIELCLPADYSTVKTPAPEDLQVETRSGVADPA